MKTLTISFLWLVGSTTVHGYIGSSSTSTTSPGWSKVQQPVAFRNKNRPKGDDGDDVPSSFVVGPKVSGHSVVSIPIPSSTSSDEEDDEQNHNGRAVLLFGGLTGPAGSPCTDETWEFTTTPNNAEWRKLSSDDDNDKTSVRNPRKRMYAASALLNNKLMLFGGWDPAEPGSGGEFLNDIWEFDLTTNKWSELETKLPFPVSRHTACTISKCGPDNQEEEMIVLHTYKGIWLYKKDGTLIEQPTTTMTTCEDDDDDNNNSPDGYSMCCVAPLNESQMLLFGGSTKTQQMSQDAYVLDCHKWTWTKLDVFAANNNNKEEEEEEERPPITASSCAAQISDNQVVIFGGASIGSTGYEGGMGLIPLNDTWLLKVTEADDDRSNKKMAHWTKIEYKDDNDDDNEEANNKNIAPEGRVAGSLSCIGPSSFLLQGGYDPLTKTTFEEPWIFKL